MRPKFGEFAKGPWTISQYGHYTYYGPDERELSKYAGGRYTINEIGVDVHILINGSRKTTPDNPEGYIMRPEDVREVTALLRAAPDLRDALKRMLDMHSLMMKKVNHSASYYDADTIREMNEAPSLARKALAYATTPVREDEGI
jgi:hypothetical protein